MLFALHSSIMPHVRFLSLESESHQKSVSLAGTGTARRRTVPSTSVPTVVAELRIDLSGRPWLCKSTRANDRFADS